MLQKCLSNQIPIPENYISLKTFNEGFKNTKMLKSLIMLKILILGVNHRGKSPGPLCEGEMLNPSYWRPFLVYPSLCAIREGEHRQGKRSILHPGAMLTSCKSQTYIQIPPLLLVVLRASLGLSAILWVDFH